MKRCLNCHQLLNEQTSWRKLFMLDPPPLLCESCEQKLVKIEGKRCAGCSRPIERDREGRCYDCERWQKDAQTRGLLERNLSLFQYNDFLKEWLATYKFRGDAACAIYFSRELASLYKKEFTDYLPVEIPLSKERLLSRRFNQSALLLQGWAEEQDVLHRKMGEKQSKRNRRARIAQIENDPFLINEAHIERIEGKKIVLVDDIYTTGTTVRQAARILKKHGATIVASMTIAR